MDGKCKILQIMRGHGNRPTVLMEIEGITVPQLIKLQGWETLSLTLKKYREKRSLNANSYYWKLCRDLAHEMDTSEEEMHNQLLERYGVYRTDEDGNLIPHFLPDSVNYLKKKYDHYTPAGSWLDHEGTRYCKYWELKGSSEYDSKEMGHLIEGLISECKECGIETIPPAELERMMKEYAKKHDEVPAVQQGDSR